MMHHALLPFVAGLLVGVNPFLAPPLHARLRERARRTLHLETALATLAVMGVLAALAWRFSAFLGGRLTNGLLVLGLFALGGAFYSLRPLARRRDDDDDDERATGWRWLPRYAGDVAYYAGPAWALAAVMAMQQLTPARFAAPFAAAAAGVIVATVAWTTALARALPDRPSVPGEARTRAMTLLSIAYGASAVLLLAAHLKLL